MIYKVEEYYKYFEDMLTDEQIEYIKGPTLEEYFGQFEAQYEDFYKNFERKTIDMKNTTLIATGKTDKQVDRQVGRWFKGNPNRKSVNVKTDKGVVVRTAGV